jgi:hypothetical protein
MTRTWNSLVLEGKQLVEELRTHRFRLGDLANESGDVAQYAEAIGLDPGQLETYARVAAAWPVELRVNAIAWSSYLELADNEDRKAILAKLIDTYGKPTVTQVRAAVGRAGTGVRFTSPPAERVKLIKKMMSDPDVVKAMAADSDVRYQFDDIRNEQDKEAQREHIRYSRTMGLTGTADARDAVYQLGRATSAIYSALQDLKDVDLTEQQQLELIEELENHEHVLGWLRSRVLQGRSFDSELEGLLKEV